MTDSLTSDEGGSNSNELLRAGLVRVNSLLSKVRTPAYDPTLGLVGMRSSAEGRGSTASLALQPS